MPQYAYFDSTAAAPQPVLGWYDTDAFTYPSLPAAADLLLLTTAQWDAHFSSQFWQVNNGQIETFTPPAQSLTVQEQAIVALGSTVTVTSSSSSSLNGTYSCNESAQARLNRIIVYLQLNGTFPNGATNMTWMDHTGSPHVFDQTQFKSFATALGDYVAALDDVVVGISTTLPSSSLTIA